MKKSWRTTLFGSGGLLAALVGLVVGPLLDEDPATVPMWAEFFAIAAPAVGLLFARDNRVTSEESGAASRSDATKAPEK